MQTQLWPYGPLLPGGAQLQSAPAAADNPPFGSRSRIILSTILAAWQLVIPVQQPRPFVVQEAIAAEAPVLNVRPWLPSVLSAWHVPDPQPTLPRQLSPGIPGQSVDDPPLGQRPWLPAVIESWKPADPTPSTLRFVVQGVEVNDPPFGQRSWLPGVIAAWEPAPPAHVSSRHVPIPGEAVNDPPFGQRPWLPGVIAAWEPGPEPILPHQLSPGIPGQSLDDPPFGQRAWLSGVIAAWEPGSPAHIPGRHAPIPEVNDPPFGQRAWLPGVISAWEPAPPAHIPSRHVPIPEVNDPPFGQRTWLSGVIASWQPVDFPAITRPIFAQAVAADNPPFGIRPWIPTVLASWTPADPPSQSTPRAPIQPAQVDDPPFGQRSWLPQVLQSWQRDPDVIGRPAVMIGVEAQFTTFGVITRNLRMPGMTVYFEVTLSTSNATFPAQARLFNITDALVVPGSTITTTSLTATRVRSAALTLPATAKEYRVEFGGQTGGTYTIYSGDLIFGS